MVSVGAWPPTWMATWAPSALSPSTRAVPFFSAAYGRPCGDIPPGTTATYGALAARLGNAKASRAVGLANSLNPVAILIPCHRVIGANGKLTGYAGGLQRKQWFVGPREPGPDLSPGLPGVPSVRGFAGGGLRFFARNETGSTKY